MNDKTIDEDRRRAVAEYLMAFPCESVPEAVIPWWVGRGELIRARIATGRPYVKADEPAYDRIGRFTADGTDGA